MTYSVWFDIGWSFTDCFVFEHGKGLQIFKSPSTPGEFEKGFINVLELAATHVGQDLGAFLSQVDNIVHGTTVATNALVEGRWRMSG